MPFGRAVLEVELEHFNFFLVNKLKLKINYVLFSEISGCTPCK